MSQTPTVVRYHTTEYLSRAHGDEFIVVIDSLGRRWNPLKHPRDENGRFIRTFSFVTFKLPGGGTASGRVAGIDRDGNLLVKVQGTTPGADPRVDENGYVKVPHDQVQVRTVKAMLTGKGAAGQLNGQENTSVTKGVASLRGLGLNDQADKLEEARKLAVEAPNPRDPASVKRKQRAIDLMREVGESLGDERGTGFDDGTDYEEVKASLTSAERARLQTLDQVMGTTFTARHSLGDKTIDVENDEGPIKAKAGEVRIQAAESELQKDFTDNAPVWDITSGSLVQSQLEQPVKAEVRDVVREEQGQNVLPELQRSTYQRLKTGLSRLSGYKQATQVAPGDRHHEDKNGDEVIVGQIVNVDATKSRPEFTGMVTRIYTDAKGQKHVYARDFDPSGDKGYAKNYKDHSVQGGSIEIADDAEQSSVFEQLALMGASDSAKALVKSFTEDYLATMERRYASPDAKRISPTGGFFDVVPVHNRTRPDSNGEDLRIGDSVMGPNGETGVVTYIEPNENTTKVQYPNGQKAARVSSRKLTRLHGPSSDVYPGESGAGDNNYVPTREEAAADADAMGADSVAQVIRDGGDSRSIQAAMATDFAFQDELGDVDALYNKRDQTLGAGQELSQEDRDKLATWDRLAAASAGQFREPNEPPPEPPHAPEPEAGGEIPQNPDNPTEKVTEGGTTVREDDGNVIVGDNTEDPIPADDQQAIDQAVTDAEGGQLQTPEGPPEAPPEAPPEGPPEAPPGPASQALADKLVSDLGRLVDEAENADLVSSVQLGQLDKWRTELSTAVDAQDGQGVVDALRGMTRAVNSDVNKPLRKTRLASVLNGRATNGTPMADFVQAKLDAGDDIFSAPTSPVTRTERPPDRTDETPEGVEPTVDQADSAMSEALLMDDGSTLVMDGDQEVNEGHYVIDPATVTEVDGELTEEAIGNFLTETEGSDYDAFSVWFDENDGRFRMARVGVFETAQEASDAASNSGSNQYVNIADGLVYNVALGSDPNLPTEAVEDPRSEERHVRTAGGGRTSARTTAKQKSLLDHVAEAGGDQEIARISEAVKSGEEINGADASRLADFVDGLGVDQFEKPSDKGVASQMAHRLARAAGEEGARGYSSKNTALRRTSDVGIALSAQSQDNSVRGLVDGARTDVKNGDNAAAAQKFRDAADAYDALGLPSDVPSTRAREHADRLDAMGGTTAPAPEAPQAPEVAQVPGDGVASAEEELANAGVPEVLPITRDKLSNPDTDRVRAVSPQEFAALAVQGKDSLAPRWENASEPEIASGEVLAALKNEAWDSVQEEWGGMTVDAHHAQIIDPDQGYALTVKHPGMETVTVPIGASQDEFDAGMDEAMQRFGADENGPLWMEGAHLGIFRNEDTGTYDIDPVLILDTVEEVEAVGAYTNGVGGAYSYADGLGYWPPYITEGGAGGEGQAVPGEVARPGGEGGEAQPGVGPPEGEGPAGPAGGGPEALEVGGTSSETLANLFDRVGQPEDYGTEYQGRKLGEARALATEGLDAEAADALDQAAAQEPDGSANKRLMQEAAAALRGEEAPAGGGGPEAPEVARVTDALNSVETAIDDERTAEGDNGPQGLTPQMEDAASMVDTIRGKITSEGPYSQLPHDLRELADWMDANWQLTDAADVTDELRATADELDASGASETSTDVPFSLRTTPLPSATF